MNLSTALQFFKEGLTFSLLDYFDVFIFIIEIISIVSFGISGALTAIRKEMDAFGVVIIGVTTGIGGGIIRDLVLGVHPPLTFANPIYAAVTAGVSIIAFIVEYRHAKKNANAPDPKKTKLTDALMFWLDSIGLAIFTVIGVSAAYTSNTVEPTWFLLCFVGVITGVGGGILRDLLTGNTPYVFVKHFYACASLCGAIVCVALWASAGRIVAMIAGMLTTLILRVLAAHFKWNLPRVPKVQ
ncbi:MAG: trimeric intracellular cation channel family protein [Ruminococcaceae bacterium]|nr:trimeric intracellular cation channel family protein [Oscillospiraceae bacterium]